MSADWCVDNGAIAICGTDMKEHHRTTEGVKWCFCCRKRHEFWCVVYAPVGMSYYGPSLCIEGVKDGCTDMFPGWTRTWDEL